MAYINTVDERYGGTLISSIAGARDAPGGINSIYVLAQGIAYTGYGASVSYLGVADIDTYSLGILSPGKYTIKANGWNWDYSNSIFGLNTPTIELLNSAGAVVGTSMWGSYSFNVYQAGTYYVSLTGNTYSSSEYEVHYTYDGALPVTSNIAATGCFS